MGLLDVFGVNDSWLDGNRGKVAGFGQGIMGATDWQDALKGGVAGARGGLPQDTAFETQKKEEALRQEEVAKQQQQRNQTVEWLKNLGFGDLADGVSSGAISGADAFKIGVERGQGAKPMEINGQLIDPSTGQVLGDYRSPPEVDKPPSGYRAGPDGNLQFIPGGPADPATAGKTTEAQRRNQQLASVMLPEAQSLLGDGAQAGTYESLANLGNQALDAGAFGINPGRGLTGGDYQQAVNSLSTIVASYLYSVSGATATDAEVKRQVDLLTPKPFENEKSVTAKKERVRVMVNAVLEAAGQAPPPSTDGITDARDYF